MPIDEEGTPLHLDMNDISRMSAANEVVIGKNRTQIERASCTPRMRAPAVVIGFEVPEARDDPRRRRIVVPCRPRRLQLVVRRYAGDGRNREGQHRAGDFRIEGVGDDVRVSRARDVALASCASLT